MEATLSGIQATLNQTDSSLQSVFARQSALEAMMIDLEDKLGKLKNSLNEYSSTTFDLLHDIHFATSHENGESPRICEDYGTSTDCDGTEKTSDEEYDPNFNLEDYFDEDSLYDRRSV